MSPPPTSYKNLMKKRGNRGGGGGGRVDLGGEKKRRGGFTARGEKRTDYGVAPGGVFRGSSSTPRTQREKKGEKHVPDQTGQKRVKVRSKSPRSQLEKQGNSVKGSAQEERGREWTNPSTPKHFVEDGATGLHENVLEGSQRHVKERPQT